MRFCREKKISIERNSELGERNEMGVCSFELN